MRGLAIETVGMAIIAVVAIIFLFLFLTKAVPFVREAIEGAIDNIVREICNRLPHMDILGWRIGIC